jgi:beta-xylosidase
MPRITRRTALQGLLAMAGTGGPLASRAAAGDGQAADTQPARCPGNYDHLSWGRGVEGQRKADLGDGTFLNPILSGDRPDPTLLRDGDDYYMTFSSFDACPGVVIWHSRDLVNWQPVGPALRKPIGSVWACDLCRHDGRCFIYIPARSAERRSIYVIHAADIRGPWSEPIDLQLPDHIDPGHVVGEDGNRYLFLSGGDRVRLTPDGLACAGPVEHVYDPWRYPQDWDVESFSPEGPKLVRRGDWFYMVTAIGGTAGPPTGHMVIVARSKSIHGPWEDAPTNPIVRTRSRDEKWWSRGHATLFEVPGGGWWMVYHGYENGYWTLGRQALLDPVEWSADGWPVARGGDLSRPLPKPLAGAGGPHGVALSDAFAEDRLGTQWSFYDPGPDESRRLRCEDGVLRIAGKGSEPRDCSPLCFIAGDQAWEVTVEAGVERGARAGLLLFYNRRLYCGLGFDERGLVMHRYGLERRGGGRSGPGDGRLSLRLRNDRHIVTLWYRAHGADWLRFPVQMEVSGYHHNVAYDFLSLRPAIYAAGPGVASFRNLTYQALA